MKSNTNNKIESGLLKRAIDEGFAELIRMNPIVATLPQIDQDIFKKVYGLAFIDGSNYSMDRLRQLTK